MPSPQIERIQDKLVELRRLDPQGSVLFGAADSHYQLNPPATEELLHRFEAKYQLALPEGYREFLLHVGNGGAGPYYGLYELDVPQFGWRKAQAGKVKVVPFSSAPEYTARHWAKLEEEEEASEADDAFYAGLQEKALEICTPGCEMETFLVVDGPRRGQVWAWDAGAAHDFRMGFWPETLADVDDQIRAAQTSDVKCSFASDKTNWEEVTVYDINPFGEQEAPDFFDNLPEDGPLFLDWYEHWLNAGLRYFELNR